MVEITLPGREPLPVTHLVCAAALLYPLRGPADPAITGRLLRLRERVTLHPLAGAIDRVVDPSGDVVRLPGPLTSRSMADYLSALAPQHCAAFGHTAREARLLAAADFAIGIPGRRGIHPLAADQCHLITLTLADALDFLLVPLRIVATLRR